MSVGEMVVIKSALGVPYDGFGTGRGGLIKSTLEATTVSTLVLMLEATMVLTLV